MFTYAKSTTFVNDLVSGALAVLQDTTDKTTESANLTNVISIDGCDNVNLSHIDLKQVYTLDLKKWSDYTKSISADQLLDAMTKATSDAAAKAGLGVFSEADSTTIVNATKTLSTNLAQKINTGLDVTTSGQNGILCHNSTNVDQSYVNMSQFVSKAVQQTVTSTDVAKAMQSLKSTVDAASSAKATGMDFSLILLLVLAGLGVAVLGPMAFVKGMVQKKGFWLAVALLGTGISGYMTAAPLLKIWPYREKLLCDKTDADDTKKTVGLAVAGTALGLCAIADVVVSVLMLREAKP